MSALISHSVDDDHRDLAVAYASLLRKIHNSGGTSEFEIKPVSESSSGDLFGSFSEMVGAANWATNRQRLRLPVLTTGAALTSGT
jgi:hypothetical protein